MVHFKAEKRGSVVKCLTHNSGVLDSSHTGSSGFFMGISSGKTLRSPSLLQIKSRKDKNDVSYSRDMTEITVESGVKHHSILTCTIPRRYFTTPLNFVLK